MDLGRGLQPRTRLPLLAPRLLPPFLLPCRQPLHVAVSLRLELAQTLTFYSTPTATNLELPAANRTAGITASPNRTTGIAAAPEPVGGHEGTPVRGDGRRRKKCGVGWGGEEGRERASCVGEVKVIKKKAGDL
ncbi:hypothetical protein SLA2020_355190 [Shorea laevis]